MTARRADTPPAVDDESVPEPGHAPMPQVLKLAWMVGFAFLLASVVYAFWRY
ncbi:MAG: hypothetical protein P8180_15515 [Gammaproteobacteria bacterium]